MHKNANTCKIDNQPCSSDYFDYSKAYADDMIMLGCDIYLKFGKITKLKCKINVINAI